MLPVSAWPPGPPGSQLSPFGRPRVVDLAFHPDGYVLPKGAWVVQTGANRVIMFRPEVEHFNPPRVPGTGLLPGQGRPPPPRPCPPVSPAPPQNRNLPQKFFGFPGVSRETGSRPTHDQFLEGWRAWQRRTGRTDPPIRPLPGRVPPNFFGWRRVCAPGTVVVPSNAGGTVLADGQNVIIAGCGFASVTQAFSV